MVQFVTKNLHKSQLDITRSRYPSKDIRLNYMRKNSPAKLYKLREKQALEQRQWLAFANLERAAEHIVQFCAEIDAHSLEDSSVDVGGRTGA